MKLRVDRDVLAEGRDLDRPIGALALIRLAGVRLEAS